ncbi:hypothetical protein B0T19DRAFT_301444 [Cercophora scortea]|uniref:Transmembrane protein n=1 Tax=Cercophora scortea TaxID=314031 RepID=A0AAE0I430_9PEZI|nr:hypothetical protein B0T19DRAFT_301444 [Cercophora scortea]
MRTKDASSGAPNRKENGLKKKKERKEKRKRKPSRSLFFFSLSRRATLLSFFLRIRITTLPCPPPLIIATFLLLFLHHALLQKTGASHWRSFQSGKRMFARHFFIFDDFLQLSMPRLSSNHNCVVQLFSLVKPDETANVIRLIFVNAILVPTHHSSFLHRVHS